MASVGASREADDRAIEGELTGSATNNQQSFIFCGHSRAICQKVDSHEPVGVLSGDVRGVDQSPGTPMAGFLLSFLESQHPAAADVVTESFGRSIVSNLVEVAE